MLFRSVQNLPDETGEIAYTVQNGAGTVLYWNENLITSRLRMNGRTLYVATGDQTGFIVNSNVKWVVQQWDNNKKETYIDEGSSASGLKNMIDEVNRRYTNNENYTYQVSAVIESGIASSVVIYFNENYYNRPNTGNRPTGEAVLDWDRISENWTLTVPAGVDVDNLTTTQVRDYLTKVSCSNISKTRDSWTFTIDGTRYDDQIVKVVAKAGPTTYTVTVGAAEGDTVTVTATPEDGYISQAHPHPTFLNRARKRSSTWMRPCTFRADTSSPFIWPWIRRRMAWRACWSLQHSTTTYSLPWASTSRLPLSSRILAMSRWPSRFRYCSWRVSESPDTPCLARITAISSELIFILVNSLSIISVSAAGGRRGLPGGPMAFVGICLLIAPFLSSEIF